MPDNYQRWGIDQTDFTPVDTAPSKGLDIGEFSNKWELSAPPAEAPTAAPQKFGWMDTWPVRIAKTIASGLTLPGDVYQGKTAVDVTDPAFMERATSLGSTISTGGIPSILGSSAATVAKPLIDPATADLARLARDTYGIPIRGGQISESKGVNYLDSVLKDKPFSGYAANEAEQHTAFNRAVANTIGENADKITPEVMDAAKKRLGQNYEDIAAQSIVKADDKFGQDLLSVARDANSVLAPGERSIIHGQINNILDKVKGSGEIDGKTYQALIRTGSPLDRASKSADTNVKYYAGQVKQALLDALQRSAPEDMQALLKKTNSQYKAMKTIEDLVEKSPTGDISPALLMGATRKSYSNMAYGGGGDLADLARIGQRFLKEPPQSGTAPRLGAMKILGLGGAGGAEAMLAYHDPILAAKLGILGGAAMIGKGVTNAAVGSALRSDWYANRLIGSTAPGRGPNMLQKLIQGYVPIPPAAVIPQITVNPRPSYYSNSL